MATQLLCLDIELCYHIPPYSIFHRAVLALQLKPACEWFESVVKAARLAEDAISWSCQLCPHKSKPTSSSSAAAAAKRKTLAAEETAAVLGASERGSRLREERGDTVSEEETVEALPVDSSPRCRLPGPPPPAAAAKPFTQ